VVTGAVRRRVLGSNYRRAAKEEEIEQMRSIVRQGRQEGAYGLSAALEMVETACNVHLPMLQVQEFKPM
jgi:N-acyl-D-aspartate/D-glutamate deacylase